MKKQLIAIGLASVLTAPSVALADATIYGSFRTGLEFTSGEGAGDATVGSFYSRIGLKGSSEVSEGLTASFQLEETVDTSTATTPNAGRVSKVALSGGFGTLALGNLWTASGNYYYGKVASTLQHGVTGGANGRAARMVSYSSSVGAVSFQIDRHTDDNKAATIEFGASTSAGPVEVGFAYWGKEDFETTVTTPGTTKYTTTDGTVTGTIAPATVQGRDGDPTTGDLLFRSKPDPTDATKLLSDKPVKAADANSSGEPYMVQQKDEVDAVHKGENGTKAGGYKFTNGVATGMTTTAKTSAATESKKPNPKTSFTGFYVSSSLAGMKLTVGLGSVDHGVDDTDADDDVDESQTDVSVIELEGSIGDSGVTYALQMSDSDKKFVVDALGEKTSAVTDPSETVITLTSALGGGASLIFEHSAKKTGVDSSLVALQVDF